MIVTDERVARFVGERTGTIIFPPFTCIGIDRDGEVIGGAVFNCFEGFDIQATVVGRGFTKGCLADVGHYVFDQLGCERISAKTEQAVVVRLTERLGGQIEGLLRNHFGPGRDAFVVGILKDEWKF